MLSTQSNYHLNNKESAAEFVSNMLQQTTENNNYLSNLSHVSKMCSSLTAHWSNGPNAAAAAAALQPTTTTPRPLACDNEDSPPALVCRARPLVGLWHRRGGDFNVRRIDVW